MKTKKVRFDPNTWVKKIGRVWTHDGGDIFTETETTHIRRGYLTNLLRRGELNLDNWSAISTEVPSSRLDELNESYNELLRRRGELCGNMSSAQVGIDNIDRELRTLDAEIAELTPWVPKNGERYWAINNSGCVYQDVNILPSDANRIKFGNCFKTEGEAKAACDALKEIVPLLKSELARAEFLCVARQARERIA